MIAPLVLEGTWDEICARAEEFRGCRIRLMVLSQTAASEQERSAQTAAPRKRYTPNPVILDTSEYPNPVDLPRLKKGVRVKARQGDRPIPEIPAE
jgi:hypothetical protein